MPREIREHLRGVERLARREVTGGGGEIQRGHGGEASLSVRDVRETRLARVYARQRWRRRRRRTYAYVYPYPYVVWVAILVFVVQGGDGTRTQKVEDAPRATRRKKVSRWVGLKAAQGLLGLYMERCYVDFGRTEITS